MVIDCVTYNGEKELFDLRYNILKDHVDSFIVIEFDKTFSGEDRVINEQSAMFFWQYEKVTHLIHREELYEKYKEQAENSPNTKGAAHWKREWMQKESIRDALSHAKDEDIVFICDVDEIWDTEQLKNPWKHPNRLWLKVYTYYLNNRSTEQFHGILTGLWGNIKLWKLNDLRNNPNKKELGRYGGWHFTSMGGAEKLTKKLTDSYTHESYASPEILDNVAYNIEQGKDFLGRDFTYTLDESEWPEFLKRNRDKYKHLMK